MLTHKIQKYFLLIVFPLITSCAYLDEVAKGGEGNKELQDKEVQKTVDNFVQRADEFNQELNSLETSDLAPRRELVQFKYGLESLNNNSFLKYLVLSNAYLPHEVITQVNDFEFQYSINEIRSANLHQNLLALMREHKRKNVFYRNFQSQKSVMYSDMPLNKALKQMTNNLNIDIELNEISNMKISGRYQGSIIDSLKRICKNYGLSMGVDRGYEALVFSKSSENPEGDNSVPFDYSQASQALSIGNDLQLIERAIYSSKKSKEPVFVYLKNDIDLLVTSQGKLIAKDIVNIEANNAREIEAMAESSLLRKELLKRSIDKGSEKTDTIAIFDKTIKNGAEEVIERFNVYNDTPDSMKEKLEKYSLFNCGETDQSLSADASEVDEKISTQSPASKTSKAKENETAQTDETPTTEEAAAPKDAASQNDIKVNASDEISPDNAVVESGCVTFNTDDSGIVASGSIIDVKLIEKFLVAQDTPVKQAMIETFILEVNSNWKLELQSKLEKASRQPDDFALMDLTAGLLDFATATTGGGLTAKIGKAGDITALVNFIESNSIGRKISNPIILVKDGEVGVVDKTRTFRVQESTTTTNASTATTDTGAVASYEAPLKLTVTPKINKHNDVIDLDFSFTEETYDSNTATSSSTKNVITSKLKIEPGQVVMMAGLLQEIKSNKVDSLPGLTQSIFTPLLSMIGLGGTEASNIGSELLVFINPTVITSKNINKTVTRNRYTSD